jgi:hypothetical protein
MKSKPTVSSGRVRAIASVVVLALAGAGMVASSTMNAGCTDGATPDCTGDASASCGLLPNEGGVDDDASSVDGGSIDGGIDANMGTDTGTVDTDSGDDGGGDDGGDGGD